MVRISRLGQGVGMPFWELARLVDKSWEAVTCAGGGFIVEGKCGAV